MKITKMHCAHCGSENVSCDAAARWCEQTGAWEISGLFDNTDCDDCSGECRVIAVDLDVIDEPLPAPATQTIWVLSYALPEGNTVRPTSSPDIFTTEAEAVAAFDKAMREEWPSNAPCDAEGESLPYPGDPWKAQEAIIDDKAKGDVDEPWGEWNLSSHTIPLPAPMPAAPSPDAMALLRDLVAWEAKAFDDDSEIGGADAINFIVEIRERAKVLLAGEQSQSPAIMAAPITESVHGKPIDGGKAQTINVVSYETSFTAILGAKDDASAPDIMVELQSDGWHVYIHDGANDDPSYAVILPVEKA